MTFFKGPQLDSLREKCPNTLLGLNTGKYGPEKTTYLEIFHAVIVLNKCFIPATYLMDLSLCELFFQRSVLKFEAKHWIV